MKAVDGVWERDACKLQNCRFHGVIIELALHLQHRFFIWFFSHSFLLQVSTEKRLTHTHPWLWIWLWAKRLMRDNGFYCSHIALHSCLIEREKEEEVNVSSLLVQCIHNLSVGCHLVGLCCRELSKSIHTNGSNIRCGVRRCQQPLDSEQSASLSVHTLRTESNQITATTTKLVPLLACVPNVADNE